MEFLPYLLSTGTNGEHAGHAGGARQLGPADVPDRPEPLLFAAWYRELAAAIYADELGPLFPAFRGLRADFMRRVLEHSQIWCDDIATPAVETCAQQVTQGFQPGGGGARAGTYGPDWRQWRWGDAHPAVMAHRPFEQSGGSRGWFSLVLAGRRRRQHDQRRACRARPETGSSSVPSTAPATAPSTILARLEGGRWVAATGQSGHPLSSHYGDLTRLWQDGHYLPMTTLPKAYTQNAIGTLTLRPVPLRTASQ